MLKINLPSPFKIGWQHSKLAYLPNQTPQVKGKIGVSIVNELIKDSEIISDQGDLLIADSKRSEVKTALFNFKTKKYWWNQIRPKQSGWTMLHLVAIHPDFISVYEFNREQVERMFKDTELCKAGHTGTNDLFEICCTVNSKRNTLNKLSYYGELICHTPIESIEVGNE